MCGIGSGTKTHNPLAISGDGVGGSTDSAVALCCKLSCFAWIIRHVDNSPGERCRISPVNADRAKPFRISSGL